MRSNFEVFIDINWKPTHEDVGHRGSSSQAELTPVLNGSTCNQTEFIMGMIW